MHPHLWLGCLEAGVDDQESQVALLGTLRSAVGESYEFAHAADAAQAVVQQDLVGQVVGGTGAAAQRRVEHGDAAEPGCMPSQIDGAARGRGTRNPVDQDRRGHRQHGFVARHTADPRSYRAGRHDHMHRVVDRTRPAETVDAGRRLVPQHDALG
ncbi:hypothetical protein GCM10009558_050160 [Virgisporangium aurantiacum]